ncbi:S-adenosyl-L-methionine-dependent methyltransferase [Crassisporium funariophilum]|nr:S-adenosyl-L-methionine-dependent methyltransferase [Crassisporium funariophilum]
MSRIQATYATGSSTSYTAANKDHFNETATTFDDRPQAHELARRSALAMRKQYSFDEDLTRVMDFACGTGLVSRELAPHTHSIVGVDISQAMVDRYNQTVSNQGISPEEMRAVCKDLKGQDNELEELGGEHFHVIICASSYHHFESIADITRTLAFFLKPGGVLLVVDLLKSEDLPDAESIFPEHVHHIVAHKAGFSEEDIRTVFEDAGLSSFFFEPSAISAKKHGNPVKLFIAKGTKPFLD